jgi:hypothetical protein
LDAWEYDSQMQSGSPLTLITDLGLESGEYDYSEYNIGKAEEVLFLLQEYYCVFKIKKL